MALVSIDNYRKEANSMLNSNIRCLFFVVVVFSVIAITFAQGQSLDEQVMGTATFLKLPDGVRLFWMPSGGPSQSLKLSNEQASVDLNIGSGCMVLYRKDFVPVRKPMTIAAEEMHKVAEIKWQKGTEIRGRTVDARGKPIPARVAISRIVDVDSGDDIDDCGQALELGGFTAVTAEENGQFKLAPVSTGSYFVTFEKPNHVPLRKKIVIGGAPSTRHLGDVELPVKAILELSFILDDVREDFPLLLTVERENTEGHFDQADRWRKVKSIELEDDSRMEVNLGPGLHRLILSKEGSSLNYSELVDISDGFNAVVVRPRPIFVFGNIGDAEGPIEAVEVRIGDVKAGSGEMTDEDGYYETSVWKAAPVGVLVSAPDGRRHVSFIDLSAADFGDRVEFSFDFASDSISGVVLDSENGEAIASARVAMKRKLLHSDEESVMATKCDVDGRFELRGVGAAGAKISLFVKANGYLPESADVYFLPDSSNADVVIELKRAVGVSGQVVGPAGEPVVGALVGCCAPGPSSDLQIRVETDSAGRFTLDAKAGAVLFATARAYTVGWTRVEDEHSLLAIRLAPRTNPVRIRVVNQDDQGVPGIALAYTSQTAGILPFGLLSLDGSLNLQQTRTDADGVLETSALPRGLYGVWLLTTGAPIELGALAVPSYGEIELTVP